MYIWSFGRKSSPDGRLVKRKSRLCAHAGMQKQGVNYWETYSLVVNWMSVRAIIALIILIGIHTKSVVFPVIHPG